MSTENRNPASIRMEPTIRVRRERVEYRSATSGEVRLSMVLGVRANTAHGWLYGEQGIRAKAIRCIRALRSVYGDVKAREWFAPIGEEIGAEGDGDVESEARADNQGNSAVLAYLRNPTPATRRAAYLALETEMAEAGALARKLRAEEENEKC